jgi:hypothetical protein
MLRPTSAFRAKADVVSTALEMALNDPFAT